jgi:hypothetical protein
MGAKILYVGDVHATPDSLEECEKLVDFVITTAKSNSAKVVCFLGDIFNTHSVIHLPVLAFWKRQFDKLKDAGLFVISLVGNHDKGGVRGIEDNALMLYTGITIVSRPTVISNILFLPYFYTTEDFIQACNDNPTHLVVCHATFVGPGLLFENGFPIADGINPNDVPQEQILSGHIHRPASSGKVTYIGAPRWRSVSDVNTERAIWIFEHDPVTGRILDGVPFSTASVCRPMFALTDTEETPCVLPEGDAAVLVDVHGTKQYVDRRKRELEALGVRVRTFAASDRTAKVKESDGLPRAMQKFFGEYRPKNGTPQEVLWGLARERISWLRAS